MRHPNILHDTKLREHFHQRMFHGFDFDNTICCCTALLFLALFLRLLKPGGRAAVIVPDGVLFRSSKAHKELRRMLIEDQMLDAVVKLHGGAFRPYLPRKGNDLTRVRMRVL